MSRVFAWAVALAVVSACSPKFDWREVRSSADAYAVALPGKPQIITRDLELPLAAGSQKVSMTMTSAGVGATMFAVGAAHLPAGVTQDAAAVQSTMAFFRDGLLRNIGVTGPIQEAPPVALAVAQGKVRGATSFEAHGHLGRPGEKSAPARLAARIYVVDDRFYQIVAMGSADDLPDNELETFFMSFHLTAQ